MNQPSLESKVLAFLIAVEGFLPPPRTHHAIYISGDRLTLGDRLALSIETSDGYETVMLEPGDIEGPREAVFSKIVAQAALPLRGTGIPQKKAYSFSARTNDRLNRTTEAETSAKQKRNTGK
jgi:hypothetical protein